MHNHVFRSIGDDLFALSTNYQIQKNADRQIFGYPGTIEKHINDQLLYGTETPDNLKRLEDVKSRVAYLKELYAVMETAGPFSKETLLKIEALLKMDIFKGDKELLNLKSELGFK